MIYFLLLASFVSFSCSKRCFVDIGAENGDSVEMYTCYDIYFLFEWRVGFQWNHRNLSVDVRFSFGDALCAHTGENVVLCEMNLRSVVNCTKFSDFLKHHSVSEDCEFHLRFNVGSELNQLLKDLERNDMLRFGSSVKTLIISVRSASGTESLHAWSGRLCKLQQPTVIFEGDFASPCKSASEKNSELSTVDRQFYNAHMKIRHKWPSNVKVDLMIMVNRAQWRMMPALLRSVELFFPPYFNVICVIESGAEWTVFFLPKRCKIRYLPSIEQQGIPKGIYSLGHLVGNLAFLWADNFTTADATHIALIDNDAVLSMFWTPELIFAPNGKLNCIKCERNSDCYVDYWAPMLRSLLGSDIEVQSNYMTTLPGIYRIEVFRRMRAKVLAANPRCQTFTKCIVEWNNATHMARSLCQLCLLGYTSDKYFNDTACELSRPQFDNPVPYIARHVGYDKELIEYKFFNKTLFYPGKKMRYIKTSPAYQEVSAQIVARSICYYLERNCTSKRSEEEMMSDFFSFEHRPGLWTRLKTSGSKEEMMRKKEKAREREREVLQEHFSLVRELIKGRPFIA